ncbi:deoxynucleoside kinase [Paenibacillus alvei]|uniref:deoxynucleoside kinase n=1 Tax=Paenibacillus alvei TaxID=44250 RepID=UPI00227EEED9|nr:deoxynucleoside kinase [Paenibacillus alvei]MCY9737543.1 deoxynucleoside kinase [Paenibacillus alvei]
MSTLSFPIILEGNECNYKTTIAQKLSDYYGMEIVKGNSFEIAKMQSEKMALYLLKLLYGKPVIIDRFLYSNLVYAAIYEGYSPLPDWYRHCIELTMNSKSAIVVHLNAPTHILEERLRLRGDDMITVDKLSTINAKYQQVMKAAKSRNVNIFEASTEFHSSDEIVQGLTFMFDTIEYCL